ncbi:MAG: hypothetical protein ABIH86_04015, partial [Planctomycetota bacterium]
MKFVLISCFTLLLSGSCILSEEPQPKPEPTPAGLFAKKVWEEEILIETKDAQKPSRILDDFEIVQGINFYPHKGPDITRRDSLIASVVSTVSNKGIVSHLTKIGLKEYAEQIKGSELTNNELKMLSAYYDEIAVIYKHKQHDNIASYNPILNNILFEFYNTIKDCKTIEDVVLRIGKAICLDLNYEVFDTIDFITYKKAIDSNIPVLLEKDSEFYIGYGYIYREKKPFIFYFDPKFVPCLIGPPEMTISDLENNNKGSLNYNSGGLNMRMPWDYNLSNLIPEINTLEPFSTTNFKYHIISGGEISYKA